MNKKNLIITSEILFAVIIALFLVYYYYFANFKLKEETSVDFLKKLPKEERECVLTNVNLEFLQKLNAAPLPIKDYPNEFSALSRCLNLGVEAKAL